MCVSGVKTPPVLEKKPGPRRVPYSSRSAYDVAGRKIKGRGAVVSLHLLYPLLALVCSLFSMLDL